MSLSSFFSSFLNVVHAEADQEQVEPTAHQEETATEAEVDQAEAEEEAEEPEDQHPIIREECKNVAKCAPLTRHFEHCQEKVSSGQGYKGEDCVEELCAYHYSSFFLTANHTRPKQYAMIVHMMHCVDACAAPKLFSKLK